MTAHPSRQSVRAADVEPARDEARFDILGSRGDMLEARLTGARPDEPSFLLREAIALVERSTAQDAALETIRLHADAEAIETLVVHAAGQRVAGDARTIDLLPALIWQLPDSWLTDARLRPFPQLRVTTGGRGHPLRPPKPLGMVYRRRIPWLDREITFRAATPQDAALLNAWMNQPRVAEIWDEAGPIERHRAYIEALLADPHMLPLIGLFDGAPFGWFEVYHAAENRIGPHYACDDFDRGWHVAIGDEGCRGAAFVSAWLPSLMHFMFLDEPRTQRIVGEPRADHRQQLRNLERSGFATLGTIDFPHKRAALVALTRDRFFRDHLWAPGAADASRVGAPRLR
jgi:RimJ/RimL family protein N-acetyltransferase